MTCRRHPGAPTDRYVNCIPCEQEWEAGIRAGELEAERQEAELERKGYWSRRCYVCGRYKQADTLCSAGC